MSDLATLAAALPWYLPTVAFVFGACVGSFLNVCIYRIPAGQSVVRPGSHCACGAPIRWHDNIPILSWFILRGRARCCGRRFSFRYPFIELLTALLFLACWLLFPPAKATAGMVLCSALIAATFIDIDHMVIPDAFTIWLGVAGLILSCLLPGLHGRQHELFIVGSFRSGLDGLLGLLVGSGLVLWIGLLAEAILHKEAMGFGDVKFVGAIGAFTGWQGAAFSVFGGAVIGTFWFAAVLLWRAVQPKPAAPEAEGQPRIAFGVEVPFGPMLAAGGLIYFLAAHRWIDAYFAAIASIL